MSIIEVYSDGSGNTFESDGGYGFVVVKDGTVIHEGCGYLASATNNVAEITAAIEGLSYVERQSNSGLLNPTEITLISDSQLVLGYASGRYQCKALHLTQLYIYLRKIYTQLNAKQRWVKGHSGNLYNERCDVLAKTAREEKGVVSGEKV
jgi:ribonuclease HI